MQALTPILRRADAFFMGRSEVHQAARALARVLDEEGVSYAVAGALALAVHGRARLTDDVDVLIRREDLARFKQRWLGRGYVEVTKGLKAVRDTVRGVKIAFLIAGDYPRAPRLAAAQLHSAHCGSGAPRLWLGAWIPGDGRPKPVAFPDPATLQTSTGDGYRVVDLDTLIELKLASGMTAPQRARDIADIIDLIRARDLPADHAARLHEYVRPKYAELWPLAQIEDDY